LSGLLFGLAFLCLVVTDLWLVDFKLNHPVPQKRRKEYFTESDMIRFLKRDRTLFRVLPLGILGGGNRFSAFKIASVSGYYPAERKSRLDIAFLILGLWKSSD